MAIEYEILEGSDIITDVRYGKEEFQTMIMQYLNDGWQLAGGVAVKSNPGVSYDEYFQALYRDTGD